MPQARDEAGDKDGRGAVTGEKLSARQASCAQTEEPAQPLNERAASK